MYHRDLQLGPDDQRKPHVLARHRRPRFLSWPNNSILLSPSTIRAYSIPFIDICRWHQQHITKLQPQAVTAPYHHLQPSHSFSSLPARNTKPLPPSAACIHLNPPLFHIAPRSNRLPSPCSHPALPPGPHTGCTARAAGRGFSHPGGNSDTTPAGNHTTSTTIHEALPGHAHPPICRRLFPPLTLHLLRTQSTQTAPTPIACPSNGRSAQ